jgi:hypothetical protein
LYVEILGDQMTATSFSKGNLIFDTHDLDLACRVFEQALGPSFVQTVHAVFSYPCNTDAYKRACNLVSKKVSYTVSDGWEKSYNTLETVIKTIKNIKNEQLLVGIFDFTIASVNIDSIYDYETREYVDLSDISLRGEVRLNLILAIKKLAKNFIIEDSVKGFHLFFRCGLNQCFNPAYKYILLGERYVCKYNILSCKPIQETDNFGRPEVKSTGSYTLLGYGRGIKNYKIEFTGKTIGLDPIPKQFTNNDLSNVFYRSVSAFLDNQEALENYDCREKVKQEIFYEWFLKEPHPLSRELAIEKMVTHYIDIVKDSNSKQISEDIFIRNEDGTLDVIKLGADTSPAKIEIVRRKTIESVYEFYDYLNSLDADSHFDDESVLQEFYSFCIDHSLEARGVWSATTGKLLFANRFYKILLNLMRKDVNTRLVITKNNFLVTDEPDMSEF